MARDTAELPFVIYTKHSSLYDEVYESISMTFNDTEGNEEDIAQTVGRKQEDIKDDDLPPTPKRRTSLKIDDEYLPSEVSRSKSPNTRRGRKKADKNENCRRRGLGLGRRQKLCRWNSSPDLVNAMPPKASHRSSSRWESTPNDEKGSTLNARWESTATSKDPALNGAASSLPNYSPKRSKRNARGPNKNTQKLLLSRWNSSPDLLNALPPKAARDTLSRSSLCDSTESSS